MLRTTVLWAAVILTILIIVGLTVTSVRMAPVKEGSAKDFWYLTCGVDTGSKYVSCLTSGKYTKLWGDYIIFSQSHQHGSDLVKVDTNDILSILPEIVNILEQRVQNNDPNDYVSQVYLNWKPFTHDPPRIEDVLILLSTIGNQHANGAQGR